MDENNSENSENEGMGTFKRASAEVLAARRIVKTKRYITIVLLTCWKLTIAVLIVYCLFAEEEVPVPVLHLH